MKRFWMTVVATCAAISSAWLAQPASAQTVAPPPANPAKTTQNLLGTKPAVEWDAMWNIPGFNRVLYIHSADKSGEGNERTWVHRPLFAFRERAEPFPNLPSIVIDQEPQLDGGVTLVFETVVTSPALRQHLTHVLMNPEFSKKPPLINGPDIFMIRWPLEDVVVDCRTNTDNRLLGSSTGGRPLDGISETLRFSINFGPDELQEFTQRCADGKVVFNFRYTFTNRRVAELEDTTRANRELVLAVRGRFTDTQKSGESPIFQEDVNNTQRWLKVNYVRSIRATDEKLLPQIKDDMVLSNLFTRRELTFEQIAQDENLRKAVAEHLKPLIDTLTRDTTTTDQTVDTKTKRRTETITLDFSKAVSLSAPAEAGGVGGETKGGGSYKLEKEKLDTIARTTGIVFKETDTKNRYAPQSINVYRLNEGSDRDEINITQRVFLSLGSLTDYFVDASVPPSFTETAASRLLSEPHSSPIYDGVPLGSFLPFMGGGDKPPTGYVFADGKSNWPDAPWVLEHLRGKPVPKMHSLFLVGSDDATQVGLPQTPGSAEFGLGSVKLPSLSPSGASPGTYSYIQVKQPPTAGTGNNRSKGERGNVPNIPPVIALKFNAAAMKYPEDWSSPPDGNGIGVLTSTALPAPLNYASPDVSLGKVTVDATALTPGSYKCRWIIRVK